MEKSTKIIVTIIIVVIFVVLSAVVTGIRSESGEATPGILSIILFAALIGGLSAVWEKKQERGQPSRKTIRQPY